MFLKSKANRGLVAVLFATVAPAAIAEEIEIDAGTVVFTENRTETDADKVGSKVEIVTKQEIEQKSLPLVSDHLNLLPGVSVTGNGGIGQETGLFVRGLPKRYVKTLYNGIDISDVSAPQPQTGYQYYLGPHADRLEVLKGSQSILYGSDAIAGVIAIDTFSGIEQGVEHVVGLEAGSFGTVRGSYGLRAANANSRFGLNVLGFHNDGISAIDENSGATERDGYENMTADVNASYRFSENFAVFGSGLYVDGRAQFDNAPFFPFSAGSDNLTATNDFRQIAGRAGFNVDVMDGRFRNTVSIQGMDIERTISGTTFDGTYESQRIKADYKGEYDISDRLTVQAGADHEHLSAVFPPGAFNPLISADYSQTGLWANAIFSPTETVTVTAGLRHDMHSVFGDHTTFRATGSLRLPATGTRFHASVGTGFRAPSLNELFGPFGANPALQPETSLSADFGVEQTLLDGRFVGDVTVFLLDVDNLIVYTTAYNNVPGTTRSRGVEASFQWIATDWLDLFGAYTFTDSKSAAGARNIRIPRHDIVFGAAVRPAEMWELSGFARIALDTVDAGAFPLDDYVLVNAKLAYKPTPDSELYVRVENLLNQEYQTVRGYGTPDFSIFAGLKAKFRTQ